MSCSVLVVEDNARLRNGLLLLIQARGHGAVGVGCVAEACACLETVRPTHLMLDLNLPDGAGTTILRRVRTQGLKVRVALLTGGSDTRLIEEAQALGVDAIFIKPPDWDRLLEWIDFSPGG